jgi:MarR family transcriptional regulator, organic hydroperoxide resistance regulator
VNRTGTRTLVYELVEATYSVVEQTEANIAGALVDLGLTRALADVVWALDPERGARSMGELATEIRCEPSTATFLVDKLHEKGHVQRGSDPRDRRRTTVALTAHGLAARDKLVQAVSDGSPVASLPEEDMRVLVELLRRALGDAKPTYDALEERLRVGKTSGKGSTAGA